MLDRATRLFFALLVAASLSACANLKAVRDFTATSAQLTGYTAVTNRYISGPQRVTPQIPEGADFDSERSKIQELDSATKAQKDSLVKIQSVVTGYMAALAQLAGDDTFNISPQIDKVTGAIVAAPSLGLNADHVRAFGTIASKVSSWILAAKQAREVKAMVNEHGQSMDKMLEAMELVTTAMKVQLDVERGKVKSYHDTHLANFMVPVGNERPAPAGLSVAAKKQYDADRQVLMQRRQAEIVWANRGYAAIQADEDAAVESASAIIEGIKLVRKGHEDMRQNIDKLSSADVKALLQKATDDLRSIRDNLKKL
jgi:hypothetical protein